MALFKVGDIVQLKSGGPKMTVTDPNSQALSFAGQVQCKWFAGAKQESGYFPSEALASVDEEGPKVM